VKKTDIHAYQSIVDSLLVMLKNICMPFSKSKCNSYKFHSPYHWAATRVEIGCAADEKSLEKKLSETQKRHYAFTNKKFNVDASMVTKCYILFTNVTI